MADINNIDNEILAVIAAAVAAMGRETSCKLVVKSFRRIEATSPVWNMTGRIERIEGKLN